MASTDYNVDLTNCDREPIHIPGYIQSHGCLIACDNAMRMVLRHSENCREILRVDGDINGRTAEEVLGKDLVHDLRNALTVTGRTTRPAMLPNMELRDGRSFDIAVHRYKSTTIIEFEPSGSETQPLGTARKMVDRIREADTVESLISRTTRLVKATLGYDRVMIYRFEDDGAGKVVSEAKQPELESFLGQYFPASDIPQQARTLYLKNTLRIISDASGIRVPVLPAIDVSGEPLDLSFAHLRSVSPIHCEYLRNMGVAASMSISVIVDGTLWGLIACHHYSPRVLTMSVRIAAEMFGEFFSMHLQVLKQKRKLDTVNHAHAALDRFLRLAAHHAHIEELLIDSFQDFADLMPCDGVGLWVENNWHGHGATPPADAIPRLARFVTSVSEGRVWATHAISQAIPEAEIYADTAAGMLAIPLSQVKNDYLLFFRREIVQNLNWAGNPEKSYETGPLGDRLTPRKSFAIWKETVRLQAQPWSDADREIAEAARIALVEVAFHHSELMAGERERAEVRQRMLNEELNHRVKNVLAIIKSLVGNPSQEGKTLQEYVSALKGRIQALSFAHDQIIRGEGGGSLRDLLDAELSPHRSPEAIVDLAGPQVTLDSRAFSVMALVLHELATNAAKYGALAQTGGKLDLRWEVDENRDCLIHWRETLPTKLPTPSRSGFGTALISRSIPYDLGGRSTIRYLPDGLEAEILLPSRHISAVTTASETKTEDDTMPQPRRSNREETLKILLVEDQMLIAMDVENMLEDNGIKTIETATSSAMAIEKLKSYVPDVAILDINLGSDTSIAVARELHRRGIPFLFATGYADASMVPDDFGNVPVIRKPYDEDALMAGIGLLVGDTERV
ncbi:MULTISPECIES: HWE histidine kinase domain-containing protein [unclassified Rhizobium]|uniref:HWE histidine kinase domain-containing protein n=1 Tax=unclassified Rhizobium TaxID=2613769 RepID=UPI000BC4295A|nr:MULTISPECIES: HWE histidine kinase domain-containing protein [unclassified Rhizobium]MDH7805100.1 light-regulated signal transduction histidine kinase (bacteriophytochrome)/CheY-like chemotaxis protein [Rhizobium sp. AN67]SOD55894.1 Bacteriophytochrome (light-regulated signal transduction histidine kinase) [Rhizobium sp. AN6A]